MSKYILTYTYVIHMSMIFRGRSQYVQSGILTQTRIASESPKNGILPAVPSQSSQHISEPTDPQTSLKVADVNWHVALPAGTAKIDWKNCFASLLLFET